MRTSTRKMVKPQKTFNIPEKLNYSVSIIDLANTSPTFYIFYTRRDNFCVWTDKSVRSLFFTILIFGEKKTLGLELLLLLINYSPSVL